MFPTHFLRSITVNRTSTGKRSYTHELGPSVRRPVSSGFEANSFGVEKRNVLFFTLSKGSNLVVTIYTCTQISCICKSCPVPRGHSARKRRDGLQDKSDIPCISIRNERIELRCYIHHERKKNLSVNRQTT